MTPEQIAIVKANFAQVVGQKEVVGMLFYDRLFAIAPETKSLFKGDLRTQSRKLMDTLALAIGMLGLESKVVEREQSGRTVYRVRLGPFDKQAEAEGVREKLQAASIDAILMRADR